MSMEILHLANRIENLKSEAKLGFGYRFDVKPHRNDPEKWQHVMKTDYFTRQGINGLLKEIWKIHKEDAYREVKVNNDHRGRKMLPLSPGKLIGKSCPEFF
tara:strand:+ start:1646 stop:1948 length:303 start_codon:yes stop_codon:yes gene_type:complete